MEQTNPILDLHKYIPKRDLEDVESLMKGHFSDVDCKSFAEHPYGVLARVRGELAGACMYVPIDGELLITHLLVHQEYRRIKIGTHIMRIMKERLKRQRRDYLVFHVSEYNLPMQLFLRSCGFVAVDTLKEDSFDVYRFVWDKKWND